ncbi:hypothetical protein DPMN_172078 [Dreissena polymorpha]|uniref:Uncharacterized protein n=1 Tax=Dreissena polymorpha TaxID=45954 RepID=A0A9D4E1M6_DREPO|nr:hypothetical protein DPMN_172078 [Dreissena polymorpha]
MHQLFIFREIIYGPDVDNDCFDDKLDDDFNEVLSSVNVEEYESTQFQIPGDIDFERMKESLWEQKEITQVHKEISEIVQNLNQVKLVAFVKQVMMNITVCVCLE